MPTVHSRTSSKLSGFVSHVKPHDWKRENTFAETIPSLDRIVLPEFHLESGISLNNVPVGFHTYGSLSAGKDNAILVCHALTGNSDVASWWKPLLGENGNFALDTSKYFIVCVNCLGSPYGTASPVTHINGDEKKKLYGSDFPLTTIRDDINLFRQVLELLTVEKLVAVIGGSMGGMHALEFSYFGKNYVQTAILLSTEACHGAWGISWGEVQRCCICTDPKYKKGRYSLDDPPVSGLAAARITALLTYRTRNSLERRFGRNMQESQSCDDEDIWNSGSNASDDQGTVIDEGYNSSNPPSRNGSISDKLLTMENIRGHKPSSIFTAHSYLKYQGDKFVERFDANCYISLVNKLDSHDVTRGRAESTFEALGMIDVPTLIFGAASDILYPFTEQEELSKGIPNAVLKEIEEDEGHDSFLLAAEEINAEIIDFLDKTC